MQLLIKKINNKKMNIKKYKAYLNLLLENYQKNKKLSKDDIFEMEYRIAILEKNLKSEKQILKNLLDWKIIIMENRKKNERNSDKNFAN